MAGEVETNLLLIFVTIGASSILQSDNGREFVNQVVTKICASWNRVKIVHGKSRRSQLQGFVEKANMDIKHMPVSWMSDNCTRVKGLTMNTLQIPVRKSKHFLCLALSPK